MATNTIQSLSGDFVTFDIGEKKDQKIKIVGTHENPYFCGKDVCEILEYSNDKKALHENVKEKHKKDLKTLNNELVPNLGTNSLGSNNLKNLTYHSGKAVYISEPGLYSLIMKSKVQFAETFQDLVCEAILPSIRKHGVYRLEKELEKEKIEREKAAQELETKTLEFKKAERFTNKLRDMVITIKARQKDQIIYIATTNAYARQNRFKIGGVKSRAHLKSRLSTYNSGRPVGDKMYYAYISETTDYHHLEHRIAKVLGDHKDSSEAEVYNVHYDSLQPIVEYLADRFDEEIKYHQSLFEKLLKDTIEKAPTIPEPIILNGAEFRKILNGEVVATQKLDFDTMGEMEKQRYVKSAFEEFLVFSNAEAGGEELNRRDFEHFVANNGTKFNKRTLWNFTKIAAKDFEKKIKF